MYYGEIKNCDIANGEGVRVTLFVSGCTNHCKNCFQPQTWISPTASPSRRRRNSTCWTCWHPAISTA